MKSRRTRRIVYIGGAMLVGMILFAAGACQMLRMPGKSYHGPLSPLSDAQRRMAERIEETVHILAEMIGERNVWHYDQLDATARWIEKSFAETGLPVNVYPYTVDGRDCRTLEVVIPATEADAPSLVAGAHYDTVSGSPGANDNASGVAATLELARALAGRRFRHAIRLAAFVNEEPPFFQTDRMGSLVYARRLKEQGVRVGGMMSLETIGCYSDAPGSQHYPFPFGLAYPGKGDFIGFVANTSSSGFLKRAVGSFRAHAAFPSEGVAAPGCLTGIGWSDHWAFWQIGCPALMITDTALFRYSFYHTELDTPDKCDYKRMARVVEGIIHVVEDLAKNL